MMESRRHPAPAVTAAGLQQAAGPMEPSRRRLDPDRIVGFAFVALLPFVLWLART